MAHFLITGLIGMIAGIALGTQFVSGGGVAALVGIASPSFAGAYAAAPLGIFTGITGGIIGGIVGIILVYMPLDWLFMGSQIIGIFTSMLVAGILSMALSLTVPH